MLVLKQIVQSAQSAREDAADESDVLEAWISLGGVNQQTTQSTIRDAATLSSAISTLKTENILLKYSPAGYPFVFSSLPPHPPTRILCSPTRV